MAARTRDVAGKLRDVRKASGRQPIRGGNLVTRSTIQFLVRRRSMREPIALLCGRAREEIYRDRGSDENRGDDYGADPHFNAHPCPSQAGMSRTKTSHLSAR